MPHEYHVVLDSQTFKGETAMPETPVDSEVAEISLPPAPPVPVREGEERFAAGLNLEDARRRESHIASLQDQLRALGRDSAATEIIVKATGRAERERQRLVRLKIRELASNGSCKPATIINLNPVSLDLTGQLIGYNVPACGKGKQINLKFRGREFVGSYLTITTPQVWLKTTGHSNDPTGDRPTFETKHIPPIGIAHQFYLHYCSGAASGQRMGGIVTFEGTIHTLEPEHMERSKRKIKVPRGEWDADLPEEPVWVTHEASLEELLAKELAQQRAYAEVVIAQGHAYATSQADDERKQLSNRHRVWHDYALGMGYITKGLPWASETLNDDPLVKAIYCPDCTTKQENPEQYFCRNCNAPFDAYQAFMAGRQVSPDRLAVYDVKSREWQEISAEMALRREKVRQLMGESETKKARG